MSHHFEIEQNKEKTITTIEKAKELLEAIKTDPKAKEMLKGAAEPKSEEDMIRLCAEIAPKLGFDVSEADLREAVAAMARERADRTAEDVQKLSDEDAAKASGGGFGKTRMLLMGMSTAASFFITVMNGRFRMDIPAVGRIFARLKYPRHLER